MRFPPLVFPGAGAVFYYRSDAQSKLNREALIATTDPEVV